MLPLGSLINVFNSPFLAEMIAYICKKINKQRLTCDVSNAAERAIKRGEEEAYTIQRDLVNVGVNLMHNVFIDDLYTVQFLHHSSDTFPN